METMTDQKTCPKCAEEVKSEAEICRFCGWDFKRGDFTPKAKSKRVLPWVVAASVGAAAVLVAGSVVWASNREKSSAEPKPATTYSLAGTLSASECGGGYDIAFTSVDIRDQNDKLIGSGTTSGNESGGYGCEVSFDIEVPKANFYQITIGTHGGPSYSFEEMEKNDWDVDLSLD